MATPSQINRLNHKHLSRKFAAVVSLLVILAVTAFLVVNAYIAMEPEVADTFSPEPQMLGSDALGWQFIKTVLHIDTSRYNVTVSSFDGPRLGSVSADQIALTPHHVKYDLNGTGNTLRITCAVTNGTLTNSNIYIYTGNPLIEQTSSNLTEAATRFLFAYQGFSGFNCTEMIETLADLEPANGTTVTGATLNLQ